MIFHEARLTYSRHSYVGENKVLGKRVGSVGQAVDERAAQKHDGRPGAVSLCWSEPSSDALVDFERVTPVRGSYASRSKESNKKIFRGYSMNCI